MDEGETKTCENCKRDIPVVNFTIHSIHCARNIRMCPVCKEPFPQGDLQDHHAKMHKLLPCKQCGESVCGTDLEDHIRDSCAHTMQTCKFCSLELRRGELPAHERYCGARTEQCEQCGEWVMMRYRQLHLDSNHGFIRLEDDPPPFRKDKSNKMFNDVPKTANGIKKPNTLIGLGAARPKTEIRYFQPGTSNSGDATAAIKPVLNPLKEVNVEPRASSSNGAVPRPKRTNDQPQINTAVAPTNKINKNMSISRGAIKKRPAPKPPVKEPAPDPKRDIPYYKALQRQQEEDKQRMEQNALNLALGLPPVLTPLEKLEKLRKMDALQNREVDDQSYKSRLNGRVWASPGPQQAGHVLGSENLPDTSRKNVPETSRKNVPETSRKNLPETSRSTERDLEAERRKNEFKNLKPMTPEEFMERFNELQLKEPQERKSGDRFSQIKTSLRELRRGLNEVTAPYNSNANADVNHNRNCISPEEVRLPCEFCGEAVLLDDLVQHQTGCRPDLACIVPMRARSASPAGLVSRSASPALAAPRSASPPRDPVIPCEFCAESLPVYLISEHQERCGRESNLLFAD